jgi:hypothetical protein
LEEWLSEIIADFSVIEISFIWPATGSKQGHINRNFDDRWFIEKSGFS